jgi:hypothetical protein
VEQKLKKGNPPWDNPKIILISPSGRKIETSPSNAILPLPTIWLVVLNPLSGVRPALDLVRAGVRVGVVLLVQVAEGVIDFAMFALIGADIQQQVAHRALALGHRPVLDRDVRGVHLLPQRQAAGVEVCDLARVGDDCFFFEVADEAVAGAWGD